MAEEIERNFTVELDEVDFDTLFNANLKFDMDIPATKIRKFFRCLYLYYFLPFEFCC